jgi:hypothetical protein
MNKRTRALLVRCVALPLVLLGAVFASGAVAEEPTKLPEAVLEHLSSSVVVNYYSHNESRAPARLRSAFQALDSAPTRTTPRSSQYCAANANKDVYNCDFLGLPQNEESITACPTNDNLVLGGTNDYRGLLDPEQNFTGWHWSTDGGHSITNEGLLPPVRLISNPNHQVPSGGDPVDFIPASPGCQLIYAASLAFDPVDPFGAANGIAVYRSDPQTLSTCDTTVLPSNPACWPTRRLVAESDAFHFLDKEWLFVGGKAGGPLWVWVVYSDFNFNPAEIGEHPFEAQLKAVRCDAALVTCTEPIPISTVDEDVQFGDVTVAPDGQTYVTWSRIDGELEGTDQVFTHKIRVAPPDSIVFGPEHVVHVEDRAIPFGGFVHANDFRIATYPKNDVVPYAGHNRIFVIWDACKVRLLGFVCEEPEIKLSYSDDQGATWTGPIVLSNGGDNYFPSISADRNGSQRIAATWFTNYYDVGFHNAQDVVTTSINVDTGEARGLKRLTGPQSNETEADPLLGGVFIGDYIEGALYNQRFYVHYNGNWRQVPFLGGLANDPTQPVIPVNQQDNYLAITGLN